MANFSHAFNPIICLRLFLVVCGIYLVLSVIFLRILIKIHTILVSYIICSYLLSEILDIKLLESVSKSTDDDFYRQRGGLSTIFAGLLIFLGLTYIEFIF